MEALGIDWKLLIAQLVNFFLFFLILKKYLAKPFSRYLSDQEKKEKEKERLLKEIQQREENIKKREKEILEETREEGMKIVNEAKQAALKSKEEILQKARKEAEEIRASGKRQVEEERRNLYRELKSNIITGSVLMVKTVLKEFITQEKQSEILQNLFKRLKERKSYENW